MRGIHQSSVSRITDKDRHLKCFEKMFVQELADANRKDRLQQFSLSLNELSESDADVISYG